MLHTIAQSPQIYSFDQTLEYFEFESGEFLTLTGQHVALTLGSVAIATVVGIAIAVATYRSQSRSTFALAALSVILTIPSFAMFAFFIGIPFLAFNNRSIVLALVLYALLPIVRNTVTGLRGVDSSLVDSARGLGMSRAQILRRVELPLAWPVIIAGLRVSTLLVVGIAAIGALLIQVGLGVLINDGLTRQGGAGAVNLAVIGTVAVTVLAVLLDGLYLLLNRFTVSKGIRG